MQAAPKNRQTVATLNTLRRAAVELRLAGKTLAQTKSETGLSAPTIISAFKAYEQGGWDAVDVGPRGRPKVDSATAQNGDLHPALIAAATLRPDKPVNDNLLWSSERALEWINKQAISVSRSTTLTWLNKWHLQPESRYKRLRERAAADTATSAWTEAHEKFSRRARRKGTPVYWVSSRSIKADLHQLFAHDLRGHAFWCLTQGAPTASHYQRFLQALHIHHPKGIALVLPGAHLKRDKDLANWLIESLSETLIVGDPADLPNLSSRSEKTMTTTSTKAAAPRSAEPGSTTSLTHLQRLEAESIQIMREVVAEADNPVMLYSVGKDSAVMLHLARKAFFPATPPFPLLHVDTGWKFKAMYEFRDSIVKDYGMELLTHINPEGLAQKVNPFTHGSSLHTDIMKTQGLKQALDEHKFDIAFGGARRDEEKSRAKERVFSFRSAQHRWDAKNQRPELWQLYNSRKQRDESIRVFPISNWTELDIWQYIHRENIPIVPLYLAAERPVVMRDGALIMVDDDRMPMKDGEVPEMRSVRFRTLGCYPLTGAVESTANTLEGIIQEMLLTRSSERQGRMIDHDSAASMEKKKQEGYF